MFHELYCTSVLRGLAKSYKIPLDLFSEIKHGMHFYLEGKVIAQSTNCLAGIFTEDSCIFLLCVTQARGYDEYLCYYRCIHNDCRHTFRLLYIVTSVFICNLLRGWPFFSISWFSLQDLPRCIGLNVCNLYNFYLIYYLISNLSW